MIEGKKEHCFVLKVKLHGMQDLLQELYCYHPMFLFFLIWQRLCFPLSVDVINKNFFHFYLEMCTWVLHAERTSSAVERLFSRYSKMLMFLSTVFAQNKGTKNKFKCLNIVWGLFLHLTIFIPISNQITWVAFSEFRTCLSLSLFATPLL